ncbi:MAG: PhnD/SsuA/transferrin family substrate-binding protein [Bowdeniella nasicola]|nr:PhnD/SsuA/transferrin family substrate-binding protein [Bowdeniella nasicola]
MTHRIRRRPALVAAVLAALLALTACGSSNNDAETEGSSGHDKVRLGQWIPGAPSLTALTSLMLAENQEIQDEHDLTVEFTEYKNLQAMYTDLSTGRIDGLLGGPEAFAASSNKGASAILAGSFSRSNAMILSTGPELTAENLRGKRMVAPTTTSTWQFVRLQIEDVTGLEAEKDYQLVTAENSNASIQQLAAGTADFAMAWGEGLVEGLEKFPTITIVADPEELAGGEEPFIQFAIAVNSDNLSPEVTDRLVKAYAAQAEWMRENPGEADSRAQDFGRLEGTIEKMLTEPHLFIFDVKPFPGPEADELRADLQLLVDTGHLSELPGPAFFNDH